MNSALKSKWLEKLRSGEYNQGKELLRTKDNNYCCLGVLCECLDGVWLEADKDEPLYFYTYRYKGIEQSVDLLGFEVVDNLVQKQLIKMNDKQEKTFTEIADYIEQNI